MRVYVVQDTAIYSISRHRVWQQCQEPESAAALAVTSDTCIYLSGYI